MEKELEMEIDDAKDIINGYVGDSEKESKPKKKKKKKKKSKKTKLTPEQKEALEKKRQRAKEHEEKTQKIMEEATIFAEWARPRLNIDEKFPILIKTFENFSLLGTTGDCGSIGYDMDGQSVGVVIRLRTLNPNIPEQFNDMIDPFIPLHEIICTHAHELGHAKQYFDHDFTHPIRSPRLWRGRPVLETADHTAYLNEPHEVGANKIRRMLMKEWMKLNPDKVRNYKLYRLEYWGSSYFKRDMKTDLDFAVELMSNPDKNYALRPFEVGSDGFRDGIENLWQDTYDSVQKKNDLVTSGTYFAMASFDILLQITMIPELAVNPGFDYEVLFPVWEEFAREKGIPNADIKLARFIIGDQLLKNPRRIEAEWA